MQTDDFAHSWLGPSEFARQPQVSGESQEISRLWQTFMTARLLLGIVLVALQLTLMVTGTSHSRTLLVISGLYVVGALASRLLTKPARLGKSFNATWLTLVGLDVLVFSLLQFLQGANINYTPLFALPILLASVLGSLGLALGTAAGITMLLLSSTWWTSLQVLTDSTPAFVQSALSGLGYFAIALLANQLSSRLVTEGQRARLSLMAARIQQQVNELVIESLPEGVLIVDSTGSVRAANPAARRLLGSTRALHANGFNLRDESGWMPLLSLTRMSVGTGHSQEEDVTIRHEGHGPRRVRARTRLAAPQDAAGESLCVIFLQDQRELEARMRTEKLASMGRMSTAVAHEIRNPLAAISQANALLAEDISDPRLLKLTSMVTQNTKRLDKIVDDILNIARVQPQASDLSTTWISLDQSVQRVCHEWSVQTGTQVQLAVSLTCNDARVRFDGDHLRRILVNLLDNARRYASKLAQAIQVHTFVQAESNVCAMAVWSDGPPMEQSVERHLFEPFFSSESRSSGLGLYICRELCEGHGAAIVYQRNLRLARSVQREGNEFLVTFATSDPAANLPLEDKVATPWQTNLY